MQTFFAESLYEHAFSRKTFEVQETEIGAVDVEVFRSELDINEAQTMSSDRLYDYFNKGELKVFFLIEIKSSNYRSSGSRC